MSLSAPAPLDESHVLDAFRCAEPELESWLEQRARRNHAEGASRCFVVCDGSTVVGYYALAAGAVLHTQVPGNIRRNMPEPIPVVALGRLAVHADWAGRGIGAGLLKDAVLRSKRLSEEVGVRALLCHAINDSAREFYLHHGFVESPIEPMTLMLNLAKLGKVSGR
ncbi:GNAT family N-acetyltransferase [Solimonas fluminis]|uniref:GNAT family N-acetyltransferase n=1 Tax=Solimonas fluminis TaxID=2086571 RepID=UPI001FAF081C|nr:GNAT family N-acetyltransferase [Solimonas fluminis]